MPPARKTVSFLRVLIVDRHAVARQGLKALLDQTRSFTVSESESVQEAIDVAGESRPDVILLGAAKPDEIATLAAASPTSRIVVLGEYDDSLYAGRALDAGATDYLPYEQINGSLPAILESATKQTRPTSRRS